MFFFSFYSASNVTSLQHPTAMHVKHGPKRQQPFDFPSAADVHFVSFLAPNGSLSRGAICPQCNPWKSLGRRPEVRTQPQLLQTLDSGNRMHFIVSVAMKSNISRLILKVLLFG